MVFTGNSGLTHYSFCLTRALWRAGADVTLVTNANYELDAFGAEFPVVRLFHRSRMYLRDVLRFWRLYIRERPDVIHYQSFLKFPAVEAILIKLQQRKHTRLVYTAHDWLPHRQRRYHPLLFRYYYRQFHRIIVHSDRGAGFLAGELGVDPDRICVIPHGEYGFFANRPEITREVARQRLGLDQDRTWYLFFGHIDRYKGLDVALGALGRLAAEGTLTAGLVIAGNPNAEGFDRYREVIEKRGLEEVVNLNLGHIPVEDIQLYFKAADVVLLPYRESSTSGLAHVAMGFGLPLIASDVGGLPAVIGEAGAGIIVPPGDERALAAAMAQLADGRLAREMGEAWTGVMKKYSWDSIAARTLAAYGSPPRERE